MSVDWKKMVEILTKLISVFLIYFCICSLEKFKTFFPSIFISINYLLNVNLAAAFNTPREQPPFFYSARIM